MPTAAEHRTEARSLDQALETLSALRARLESARADLGMRGGTALLVDGALAATTSRIDELGRLVDACADELRLRADLCDRYTLDLRRHTDALRRWRVAADRYRAAVGTDLPEPWPGPEPPAPVPPFPGAEAG